MGYTVREVIDAVERGTSWQVPLRIAGRRRGDPAVLVASSERIRCDLRWAPRFQNLDEIVASAWRWMGRRTNQNLVERFVTSIL